MPRIKHLTEKVSQLDVDDQERRSLLGWIGTLLCARRLKEKKEAAKKIEKHARRLAY